MISPRALHKFGGTGQVPNRQEVGGTGQAPNRQEVGGTGQAPNRQELEFRREGGLPLRAEEWPSVLCFVCSWGAAPHPAKGLALWNPFSFFLSIGRPGCSP
ncbi:MAG: hypothetical protein RBU37_12250 [Myxococcota bacterium]|nr:hypothetical protein [Myxococcota bacterium]